jgi:hypothetical protein
MPSPYRAVLALPAPPAAPTRRHRRCERCDDWVLPRRPHPGWRVAEVSAWVVTALLLLPASKGPWMVLMPLNCAMGLGLFGPLRAKSQAEPRCPTCRCYVDDARPR